MASQFIAKIKQIFVGRKDELEDLEKLWDFSQSSEEHFVHVILNAPGIGKPPSSTILAIVWKHVKKVSTLNSWGIVNLIPAIESTLD